MICLHCYDPHLCIILSLDSKQLTIDTLDTECDQ